MRLKSPLIALTAAAGLLLSGCGGSASQRAAVEAQQQSGLEAAAPADAGEAPAADAAPATDESAPEAPAAAEEPATGDAPVADTTKAKAGGSTTTAATKTGAKAKKPGAAEGKAAAAAPAAPAAPSRGGATDTGVSANSIKVGHIGIYSGPVGTFGDDLSQACRAGLQAINDSGGVAGRKLDVKVRDDAWDATKGSNAVRDLVEREKVFGFACSMSVPTNDAITPYLDSQKVPNVGSDGWGEAQYAGAWSFPVGASGENEAINLATYQVKTQGAKKIGILHWNNTVGKSFAQAYTKTAEALGADVVVTTAANFDDPSTSVFIAQARSQGVDTITTQVDPGIFARMVREAAAQGFKPKNGYSGAAALYFEATPGLTGPAAEGTIATVDWVPDDPQGPAKNASGYTEYKNTVEKYYPNIDHSNWTKAGYVGAKLFGSVLKRLGGNLTRQAVKDDIDKITNFDSGLGPKLTWRPGLHRSNTTTYLVQLQKGAGGKLEWKYLAGPIIGPRPTAKG